MRRGRKKSAPRYWLCQGCGTRNERIKQKCQGVGCKRSRPKKRVPKHAIVLRDTSYEAWAEFSQKLHGGQYGACAVCGRMPKVDRNNDRDHDHWPDSIAFGKPRGLACPHCNSVVLKNQTLKRSLQVVRYLLAVELHYLKEAHQAEEEHDHDSGEA